MHLVIDGYNLIHATPEFASAQASGQGHVVLTLALKLYRQYKSHKISVVLDGGPQPGESRSSLNGVPIIYSGPEQTADDVIARIAARHGPGITVITDDRELAGRCAKAGSEVINSTEFSDRLAMVFMMMDDIEPADDEEGWDFTTKKKGPGKRLKKSQRKKNHKLDQL